MSKRDVVTSSSSRWGIPALGLGSTSVGVGKGLHRRKHGAHHASLKGQLHLGRDPHREFTLSQSPGACRGKSHLLRGIPAGGGSPAGLAPGLPAAARWCVG